MAKQYGFYLEVDRCIRCYACEVACKDAHDIEPGPRWMRVLDIWDGKYPDVTRTFFPLACMHCSEPPCVKACPNGAISKRAEDGIVVVDRSKCKSSRKCFLACPYAVPQYGDDGLMQMCNLCLGRLEKGQEPACVASCPTNAIHVGTMEELSALGAKKAARPLVGATGPSVFYSSPVEISL
jgi:anaerobic dimethyl sulfoxide reductase subunit B (iron-sulfur subunit)